MVAVGLFDSHDGWSSEGEGHTSLSSRSGVVVSENILGCESSTFRLCHPTVGGAELQGLLHGSSSRLARWEGPLIPILPCLALMGDIGVLGASGFMDTQ
jgi:hypothetical protein